MCVATWLYTKFFGKCVGRDEFGNLYYVNHKKDFFGREKRWVYYKGLAEASKVPSNWFSWLHHQTDATPASTQTATKRQKWRKKHVPNLTGLEGAYHPSGSTLGCNRRDHALGDYEPWNPNAQ